MARLIDADAYAAEMKKRQGACMQAVENASYEGEQFSPKAHWEGVLAAFAEAKLTLDDMPTVATDINVPCKWISVKDRLPENDNEVITAYKIDDEKEMKKRRGKLFVKTANWMGDCWVSVWDEYKAYSTKEEVLYWMPLPKPPKEVSGDASDW